MDKISLDTRDRDREKESAERVRFLQAEWQQVRQLALNRRAAGQSHA